jgi:hypothetical protein
LKIKASELHKASVIEFLNGLHVVHHHAIAPVVDWDLQLFKNTLVLYAVGRGLKRVALGAHDLWFQLPENRQPTKTNHNYYDKKNS